MPAPNTPPAPDPMVTVISWCTGDYKYLADGLSQDCRRLGYPFRLYEIDRTYPDLVQAWCNHPRIIRQGVLDHGTVLFLDVECRIVRPLPASWQPPLVSVRQPAQPFWITYNTGTVMADTSCLAWLDAWIRVIDQWQMETLPGTAYIRWPNDICDELAFHAAVAALDVKLNKVALEYEDRTRPAGIVRGLWKNDHTIVQHPTLHHWVKEADPEECKKLFVQNYAGCPEDAEALFSTDQGIVRTDGWQFDTSARTYAPDLFEQHPRPWLDKAVALTSAQR
ncbi:hypothetical protein WNZ15_01040 [Roseibium sp. AS2]|uniref:hypothetical protein n=1 Tax=Roseibium sp. AS2 TaxID=3135781 RepID=UPI0031824BFE